MAQNDHIREPADVPALFADITALLEDAHEIAVRGQNSKLERVDYLSEVGQLRKILDQIGFLSESILSAR